MPQILPRRARTLFLFTSMASVPRPFCTKPQSGALEFWSCTFLVRYSVPCAVGRFFFVQSFPFAKNSFYRSSFFGPPPPPPPSPNENVSFPKKCFGLPVLWTGLRFGRFPPPLSISADPPWPDCWSCLPDFLEGYILCIRAFWARFFPLFRNGEQCAIRCVPLAPYVCFEIAAFLRPSFSDFRF